MHPPLSVPLNDSKGGVSWPFIGSLRVLRRYNFYIYFLSRTVRGWAEWSPWSMCSATCYGTGTVTRVRECVTLSPSDTSCSSSDITIPDVEVHNCTEYRPCQKSKLEGFGGLKFIYYSV